MSLIVTTASADADGASSQPASLCIERPGSAPSDGALVGTWRLISYVNTPEGGQPVYAFGRRPIGQFIFTADGHVSISIMRNPPEPETKVTDIDPDACSPAWYCSYFGTYTVAAGQRQWVTHVFGGNILSYIGTDQHRAFRIEGNRLIISETYLADGKTVHADRILERAR